MKDRLLELTKEYNFSKVEWLEYRYSDKYIDDGVKADALIHNLETAKRKLNEFTTVNMLGKI